MKNPFEHITQLDDALQALGYLPEPDLVTAVYLALSLERPLLLEGEPGVGKTELAKTMSRVLNRPLVRLQCYYGIDLKNAVYDWNYARQMLHIRLFEEFAGASVRERVTEDIYAPEFLIARPLLTAIQSQPAPVLLIDEVDRTDDAFEALLLEFLGEFQVTIPEIGTICAEETPLVILTSNRTRDVHDALRRRCIYSWLDYPRPERELEILRRRYPHLGERLLRDVVTFVGRLRQEPLMKKPGLAESLEWVEALSALGSTTLTVEVVESTLGLLIKYYDDIDLMRRPASQGVSSLHLWLAESGVPPQ